ncbi:MAG: hypothetical protein AAF481_13555 [Acidobacteriota bacterium]
MWGNLLLSILNGFVSGVVSVVVALFVSLLTQHQLVRKAEDALARRPPSNEREATPSVALPPDPEPGLVSDRTPPIVPEPPAPASQWASVEEGEGHKVIEFATHTEDGSPLILEALILTQEHRWRYGHADSVVDPVDNVVNFLEYLETRGLRARIEKSRDIVTFGMASCEGSLDSQEDLAGARAEMLAKWLRTVPSNGASRNYYQVNLGQYRAEDCRNRRLSRKQTSPQRRVVIVYTSRSSRPQNLQRAELEERIEHSLRVGKNLLFDPEEYSRKFQLSGG